MSGGGDGVREQELSETQTSSNILFRVSGVVCEMNCANEFLCIAFIAGDVKTVSQGCRVVSC